MIKLLVGGQHCPLTDGTVHCPKEYSDHLSIHANIIEYNCEKMFFLQLPSLDIESQILHPQNIPPIYGILLSYFE